jgi:hypothetical protein
MAGVIVSPTEDVRADSLARMARGWRELKTCAIFRAGKRSPQCTIRMAENHSKMHLIARKSVSLQGVCGSFDAIEMKRLPAPANLAASDSSQP